MLFSIRIIIGLVLVLIAAASVVVGQKKWGWVMKLIFGAERVKKAGTNVLAIYLYVAAIVLVILAVLIVT